MDNLNTRGVFFVEDAERAVDFYTNSLGFKLDWTHQEQGKAFVIQVSLLGIELILNQIEPWTEGRAGHGRVFIGLNEDQSIRLRQHLKEKGVKPAFLHWGAPTLVVHDIDRNELFFWVPEKERASLEADLKGA